MEKRVFGIILTVLGIAGLVVAAIRFVEGGDSGVLLRSMIVYGILGAIFFFTGISLIRSTRDIKSRHEEIS